MSTHIEPPTDPQLAMIARMCDERGCIPPEAVHSKAEASEIIDAIRTRTYDPRRFRPTRDDIERWAEQDEAEERNRYELQRDGLPELFYGD